MAEQFIASKQLPYVLQSTKLKNFFDSTVDQWFKNENNEYVHGFIGQRQGRLFDPIKDAYIPEPTVDRYNYQLEPSVVVRNADTQTISYQTTYEDLINKIWFDGGLVNDHTRLVEEKYYSFEGLKINYEISEEEALEEIERLLVEAIKKRMLTSDVPVGVLLSGGLDSSLIGAMAAKNNLLAKL